jgi:hypothetical protein
MYVLSLGYRYAHLGGTRTIDYQVDEDALLKWTFAPDTQESLEHLRLLAIACAGRQFIRYLKPFLGGLVRPGYEGVLVEFLLALHAPRDILKRSSLLTASAMVILADGTSRFPNKCELLQVPPQIPFRDLKLGSGIRTNLAMAYGPCRPALAYPGYHDFMDVSHRITRFRSLFDKRAGMTDEASFLDRLRYRCRKGRLPAQRLMEVLRRLCEKHLKLDISTWPEADASPSVWRLRPHRKDRALSIVLDSVRHAVEASPHDMDPLAIPGVVLARLTNADIGKEIVPWLSLMDELFPCIQFIVTMPEERLQDIPVDLRTKKLEVPKPEAAHRPRRGLSLGSLGTSTALLVDIDGRLPNLALMKLSTHIRSQGLRPLLVKHDKWNVQSAEIVYASCVFNMPSSLRRVEYLWTRFGDRLTLGGSGVDLVRRLPPEIEGLSADYSLYPELADRAIGFLTRGCNRKCPFCIVPLKEGPPRQVSGLAELLQGRRKLVLLDDNLLAHPDAHAMLESMLEQKIMVNFNQTLDIKLVDKESANLLRRLDCRNVIFTRSNYHFSLNNCKGLETVRKNYSHFGFRPSLDNVEFICMYGYNTTLEEDVDRFRFLRSLPAAYVFVQEYRPFLGAPCAERQKFFDSRADARIDQLLEICFPQNMKSMEKYYRWLSKRYFEHRGRLHKKLVDAIFRYNYRDRKGVYIAKMESKENDYGDVVSYIA